MRRQAVRHTGGEARYPYVAAPTVPKPAPVRRRKACGMAPASGGFHGCVGEVMGRANNCKNCIVSSTVADASPSLLCRDRHTAVLSRPAQARRGVKRAPAAAACRAWPPAPLMLRRRRTCAHAAQRAVAAAVALHGGVQCPGQQRQFTKLRARGTTVNAGEHVTASSQWQARFAPTFGASAACRTHTLHVHCCSHCLLSTAVRTALCAMEAMPTLLHEELSALRAAPPPFLAHVDDPHAGTGGAQVVHADIEGPDDTVRARA